TVGFTMTGTAIPGVDYLPVGSSVVIPAGATEATVTVTPRDDLVFEPAETITLTLTLLPAYRVGRPASATATLFDNEIGVSIGASGDSVEDGSALGEFIIVRTGSLSSDLTVNFLVGGTAPDSDFVPLADFVVIPAGTNAVTLPVVPIDDHVP